MAVAVGLLAALISPAGAAVRHWVGDAVESAQRARTAGAHLAARARAACSSTRQRGPGSSARTARSGCSAPTGSRHGLRAASTSPSPAPASCSPSTPRARIRWAVTRSGSVSDPAWSPDGYRIAYLNSGTLRVVAADGTGDRSLVRPVARVTPAWRPDGGHVLAFSRRDGSVRAIDADSGAELFATRAGTHSRRGSPGRPTAHGCWSRTRSELRLFDRRGELVWSRAAPAGKEFGAAAPLDAGRVAAVLSTRSEPSRSELFLLGPRAPDIRLFAGPGVFSGVEPSPDRRWLLLAWRSADQWLFLDLAHPQRVAAVAGISAQFAPGTTSPPPFPSVAGWCCPGDS